MAKNGNKLTKQLYATNWLLFIKTIQFKLGVHSFDLVIIPKSIHHPTQTMGEQLCFWKQRPIKYKNIEQKSNLASICINQTSSTL